MCICSTEQKPSSAISIFPYQAFRFQFSTNITTYFPGRTNGGWQNNDCPNPVADKLCAQLWSLSKNSYRLKLNSITR
jgi:hypothetical protein